MKSWYCRICEIRQDGRLTKCYNCEAERFVLISTAVKAGAWGLVCGAAVALLCAALT